MILGVIQARMSSSRLPGKVMETLLGVPMLMRQVERVQRAGRLDQLIIATSVDPSDDVISARCADEGIAMFRGSLDDVLDRFYQAARQFHGDDIVRLTGDCPLADPEIIDAVVEFYVERGLDYASNTITPTFPDGLDVEVFGFSALERAWQEARLPSEREHVTPYIKNSGKFVIGNFAGDADRSHLRLTVDELQDLALVREIYQRLYPSNPRFSSEDVLQLLDREPKLLAIKSDIERDEGYLRSLERDRNPALRKGGRAIGAARNS